jgi:two-component system cell cycle sensor histidine kinase/response regulator CckA
LDDTSDIMSTPDSTGPDGTGPDGTGPDSTGPDGTGPDGAGPAAPVTRRPRAILRPWMVGLAVAAMASELVLVAGLATGQVPLAMAGGAAVAAVALATLMAALARLIRLARKDAIVSAALEGMPAGMAVCDRADRTVFANAAFFTLARAHPGDSPRTALERLVDGDAEGLDSLRRLVERAHGGVAGMADLAVLSPQGTPEWRRVRVLPVPGFARALHWRVEDVTARRELDVVMLREQAKLVDFLDHAPVGFFSVDQDGRFLFVNATLAKWLGATPREIIDGARNLHEVLADPPRNAAPYDLLDGGGADQRGEVTMRGLSGRLFLASVAQTVVVAEDGATVHTRSVVRDLTPEREWQEALRLSEQRFQRFFEDAPIGIARLDEAGRLAECNPAFLALTGAGAPECLGVSFADLVAPADRGAVASRLSAVLNGEDPQAPLEVRLQAQGGREHMAQLYARRPGGTSQSGGAGLMLHFIDLSERKSLEAQFAQSQKMQAVGQLAGGVAHDFNNLLTAMIGFCDLLLLRHKPGDHSFSDIMQIKQNANRAANLVRQLLAFSRQQTLQSRVLNVTDVLAELANLLRRLIGENIELRMIHGRDLGLVRVDQNQLEQVIINLVVNARDAMAGGGRLTVVTSNLTLTTTQRREHETIPPGDYVTIEVIDTGFGIPRENLQRIFEPFFSTKEVGSGTGLGLSTVYGIVRQTGGFILVDSAPGEGAKFTIMLPRFKGPPTSETQGEPRDRLGGDLTGSGNILLVEDEDAVRVFSARALRNKGYQVLEAKNGEAAMTQIVSDGHRVDLLITDVVMPQMDGPTLVRKVREMRPDMRVIFISGYAEDRFKGDLDESVHFLPKPFSLKQLAAKVKEVMRASGPQ